LHGIYVKDYLDDYVMPFEAKYGGAPRFQSSDASRSHKFVGKWEVDFLSDTDTKKAIGIFDQFDNHMKGTFLTATGDYRFLEGVVDGDTMMLSCFDGTYIYLFKATLNDQGDLAGDFWSGKSWHQKWAGTRNEEFELPDPYSFTYMKEGYDKFEIKFPNPSGDLVELADRKYRNKVVVVQILGSWCPNCMDETKFYVDWISKNPNSEVEFIGLAFERKPEADYAFERILKMKEKLEVPYEVLLAGTTSQESRAQALPMLNKIFSFPTSIILNRQHKVRKIHTGFSGPGTGIYYEKYVDDFNLLIDKLINENME
jgi:thiol-disulfide isomerase/thioredoxin